jgi:hypothetical protein
LRRDSALKDLEQDLGFRSLHGDPRWKALLKKMNSPVD